MPIFTIIQPVKTQNLWIQAPLPFRTPVRTEMTICDSARVMTGNAPNIASGSMNSINSKPPGIGALKKYLPKTSTKVTAIIPNMTTATHVMRALSNIPRRKSGEDVTSTPPSLPVELSLSDIKATLI